MANILIQRVLSNQILIDDFLKWMLESQIQDKKYQKFSELCSQKDFVTFFLNVIHEELLCDRSAETPKKSETSFTAERNFQGQSLEYNSQSDQSLEPLQHSIQNRSSQRSFNSSCTSTPKVVKSYSYDSINISPIHNSYSNNQKDTDNSKTNSLCLGDFIISAKKSNSKKKTQRKSIEIQNSTPKRINPTNLNDRKFNNVFMESENSFNFQNSNSVVKSEEVDREFLKKEIEKLSKRNCIDGNILGQIKKTPEVNCTKYSLEIIPNPKLVRFKQQLLKVILIYEHLLKNGLVLSLIGELHFIISLMFNKCYCGNSDKDILTSDMSSSCVMFQEMFKSIHNVMFFACCVLERLIFLLKSLDKSTLKYLCENEYLVSFSPNLVRTLQNIAESKSERLLNFYDTNGKNNICFVLDTDNRSNFPSHVSFQSFKKQRDLFYDILKNWEESHMVPGWKFEYALGRKIKTLLSLHNDPVNFMRLARLFMDQLLSTCSRKTVFQEETLDETNASILTSLPNIDRDKFDRLKSRLVTKQSSNSINSAPDFSGYQEFYKEFILNSCPTFLRHLCDAFISEIVELNDANFTNLDGESTDNDIDQETKKTFVNCLKSLRILAKFLGFVESMPYKCESCSLSNNLVDLQVKIREKVKPNFDSIRLLEDSISKGKVTYCIPWLCKYLSMLDSITLKTSYYSSIFKILISLYRDFGNAEAALPEYNVYLVKYTLGWFFELNNFPHHLFFESISNRAYSTSVGIDRLNIVDQNILYIFCPYLDEIKKLLISKIVTRDRLTVRHITPLTAVESPEEITKRKIESQLEEAFFNGHPASLKKTVDFVAERIASTCVKHLCYGVIPDFKKKFSVELHSILCSWLQDGDNNTQEKCEKLAEEQLKILEALCTSEVNKIIQNKLKTAIHSLLPVDCLPQMESVCLIAAERMCMEKVRQWSSTHIVLGILSKDIAAEITKCTSEVAKKSKPKLVYALPPGGSDNAHNCSTESGAHILDKLRHLSVSILSASSKLQEESLKDFLDNIYKTLTQRNDLSEAIIFMICFQLVEFLLLLVTFHPALVGKTQDHFFKIWKLLGDKSEELFSNLVSPRNIMLLAQSVSNLSEAWTVKAKFCVALIEEKLLSCECFESQCTGLFKTNLDEDTLKHVTTFLSTFVDNYKKKCDSSKFTYLLIFLSDYCKDL